MRGVYAGLSVLALSIPSVAAAQTGVLVVAHGAGPEWNERVRDVVKQVQWPGGAGASVAFLMGGEAQSAGWQAGVDTLLQRGAQSIVVVPFMVSSYGSHSRQIRYYAGALDSLPKELAGHDHHAGEKPPVPVYVTPALDGAPEMIDAVVARWKALDPADRRRPVLLVGHGPNAPDDAQRWFADLDKLAAGLRGAGLRAEVRTGLMRDDAPPDVRKASIGEMRDSIQALATRARDSVVIMPVLISTGIERTKLPRDFEGLPARYSAQPLSPLPDLARWIERVAAEALPVPRS